MEKGTRGMEKLCNFWIQIQRQKRTDVFLRFIKRKTEWDKLIIIYDLQNIFPQLES